MEITKEEMLQRFREAEPYIDEYQKLVLEHFEYQKIYNENLFEDTVENRLKESAVNRDSALYSIGIMVAVTYLLKFLGFEVNIYVILVMFLSLVISFIYFNRILRKKYKIKDEGFSIVSVGADAYMKAESIRKKMEQCHKEMCNICSFVPEEYCYPQPLRFMHLRLRSGKVSDAYSMVEWYRTEQLIRR